jgi:hypothetical protein
MQEFKIKAVIEAAFLIVLTGSLVEQEIDNYGKI